MINVGVSRGTDSYKNVTGALARIEDDVVIPDKPVLIKPNFVSTSVPLCATRVEATIATLEFLESKGVKEFTIGVGPAIGTPESGFAAYGYEQLKDRFNVRFFDLNTDDETTVPAFDDDLQPRMLRISKTVAESYVVSVCPMKTHDTVVVTLGLKNVLVGALSGRDEKRKIHRGYRSINLTLAKMAQHIGPDLTVIDGTVGMQGDGPIRGFEIDSNVALASADRIAADVVGLQMMGFELSEVGYLRYCMELRNLSTDDIRTVGHTIEECRKKFQPHSGYREQLKWGVDGDWRDVISKTPAG